MEQHFFLTRETNRPDMLAGADILLFWLEPVGIIGPKLGDVIAFEGLAVYIEEAEPIVEAHNKHNWSVKIYGPDVGGLREKLTYHTESRETGA
jgi:hypothetical protein